ELAGALRHIGEEEIAQGFGCTLEGQGEPALLGIAHQALDGDAIELAEILEGEHERLDLLGGVAIALLEGGDETRLAAAVEAVEDLGDELVRVAAVGARQAREEFVAQR